MQVPNRCDGGTPRRPRRTADCVASSLEGCSLLVRRRLAGPGPGTRQDGRTPPGDPPAIIKNAAGCPAGGRGAGVAAGPGLRDRRPPARRRRGRDVGGVPDPAEPAARGRVRAEDGVSELFYTFQQFTLSFRCSVPGVHMVAVGAPAVHASPAAALLLLLLLFFLPHSPAHPVSPTCPVSVSPCAKMPGGRGWGWGRRARLKPACVLSPRSSLLPPSLHPRHLPKSYPGTPHCIMGETSSLQSCSTRH